MNSVFSRNYQHGVIAFISSVLKPKKPVVAEENTQVKITREEMHNKDSNLTQVENVEDLIGEPKADAQPNIAITDNVPKVRRQRKQKSK